MPRPDRVRHWTIHPTGRTIHSFLTVSTAGHDANSCARAARHHHSDPVAASARWRFALNATAVSERWAPDVTVATVVARDGRLLMVEEAIAGQLVLNQPAGHLESGESLEQAAMRETLEETGWTVRCSAFIGSYLWRADNGRSFLRFAFAADALSHDPARALDQGIVRALWLTPAELLAAGPRLRSPLVLQVLHDWLAGQRYPLALVRDVA